MLVHSGKPARVRSKAHTMLNKYSAPKGLKSLMQFFIDFAGYTDDIRQTAGPNFSKNHVAFPVHNGTHIAMASMVSNKLPATLPRKSITTLRA